MASGATATQLSFDLFGSTALATGFTLDAGGISRPARQAAFEPALQPAQRTEPRRAEPPIDTRGDFQLTGERGLAASWRERALDNLAAIRLAHQLRQEGRPATCEEQRRLIRFTGFGASDLANTCFLRPGESGFRPGWEFSAPISAPPSPLRNTRPSHAARNTPTTRPNGSRARSGKR